MGSSRSLQLWSDLRRDHNYRNVRVKKICSEPIDANEALSSRQVHVEHDEIRVFLHREGTGLHDIRCGESDYSTVLQVTFHPEVEVHVGGNHEDFDFMQEA